MNDISTKIQLLNTTIDTTETAMILIIITIKI